MNIIFQYFPITLFSNKNDFVPNNSKKITPIYTLWKNNYQIYDHPMNFMSDEKLNVSTPTNGIKKLKPLNFKQGEQYQSNNAITTSKY
jgi:hypothetical protein